MENGFTSSEDSARLSQRIISVVSNTSWATLLAGVTIGMVGLHLLSDGSLRERMDGMQSDVQLLGARLDDVAAVRTDVEEANDLLTALAEQQMLLDSARDSLMEMDRLAAHVAGSAEQVPEAETALADLTTLADELIGTRSRQGEAAAALDNIRDLQSRVAEVGEDSQQSRKKLEEAEVALAGVEQLQQRVRGMTTELPRANAALDSVTALQRELAETNDSTTQARAAAEQLIALKDNLNAGSGQIDSAEEYADRLIVLKDDIADNGELLLEAEQNVEQLIDLQDQLVSDERLRFVEAAANVERLIRIQSEIAAQTDDLAESINALEVLDDFQTEFNGEAAKVQDMRRQLTELILLQTTIEQALQAVEPISELGNLRRLDTLELQEAARFVLEQRRARLVRSREPVGTDVVETADTTANPDGPNAESTDSPREIHSPAIHRPVPVPPAEL